MRTLIVGALIVVAAVCAGCGASSTDTASVGVGVGASSASSSSAASLSTSSTTTTAAVAAGGQLALSGAIAGNLGGTVSCVTLGAIHSFSVNGTGADGKAFSVLVTDEQGGKAVINVGAKSYVFGGTVASELTVSATTATFAGAKLDDVAGGAALLVTGTLRC